MKWKLPTNCLEHSLHRRTEWPINTTRRQICLSFLQWSNNIYDAGSNYRRHELVKGNELWWPLTPHHRPTVDLSVPTSKFPADHCGCDILSFNLFSHTGHTIGNIEFLHTDTGQFQQQASVRYNRFTPSNMWSLYVKIILDYLCNISMEVSDCFSQSGLQYRRLLKHVCFV